MSDHYSTLGIDRNSTPENIKTAYRKLAAKFHPDRPGGNTEEFQKVQAAYEVLSDPAKKAQYDTPQPQFNTAFNASFNFDSIFDIFGAQFHGGHARRTRYQMSLWITLVDVATGGRRPVSIGTQLGTSIVEIEIPAGVNDGDTIQYHGIAPGGGDLIINFRIHPHPGWQRHGLNLMMEHTISVWDCILGCQTTVKDILSNQLNVTVPDMTQPGTVLLLRGKGLKKDLTYGDMHVKIGVRIPEVINEELLEAIQRLK
jgi:DnaJ-class molecular chaperone